MLAADRTVTVVALIEWFVRCGIIPAIVVIKRSILSSVLWPSCGQVRVLCAYRRDTDLRDSLVRSHLNNITASDEDRGTFPCGRSRCNTCAHTSASPTINTPGGCITINSKYTCISHNVVYVITCRTCNKIYIGETGRRLGDRFREHLRSTRQTNTDLPVGRHFASPRHACTDMLVSVIRTCFRDTQDRRRFEARMIFKHKSLHPGGLNTDFAFL